MSKKTYNKLTINKEFLQEVATSLLEVAKEKKAVEEFYLDILKICKFLDANPDLFLFFTNFEITPEDKKAFFDQIFLSGWERVNYEIGGTFFLVFKRFQTKFLDQFLAILRQTFQKDLGIASGFIISAYPLSEETVIQVKEMAEKHFKLDDIYLEVKVDPALIGGIKIELNGEIFDTTIDRKMERMRYLLLQAAAQMDKKRKQKQPLNFYQYLTKKSVENGREVHRFDIINNTIHARMVKSKQMWITEQKQRYYAGKEVDPEIKQAIETKTLKEVRDSALMQTHVPKTKIIEFLIEYYRETYQKLLRLWDKEEDIMDQLKKTTKKNIKAKAKVKPKNKPKNKKFNKSLLSPKEKSILRQIKVLEQKTKDISKLIYLSNKTSAHGDDTNGDKIAPSEKESYEEFVAKNEKDWRSPWKKLMPKLVEEIKKQDRRRQVVVRAAIRKLAQTEIYQLAAAAKLFGETLDDYIERYVITATRILKNKQQKDYKFKFDFHELFPENTTFDNSGDYLLTDEELAGETRERIHQYLMIEKKPMNQDHLEFLLSQKKYSTLNFELQAAKLIRKNMQTYYKQAASLGSRDDYFTWYEKELAKQQKKIVIKLDLENQAIEKKLEKARIAQEKLNASEARRKARKLARKATLKAARKKGKAKRLALKAKKNKTPNRK